MRDRTARDDNPDFLSSFENPLPAMILAAALE
jgi:hypothetical protein